MSNASFLFSVPAGQRVKIADDVTVTDLDMHTTYTLHGPTAVATDEYERINGVMCRKFVRVTGVPSWRWMLIPSSDDGAAENFFAHVRVGDPVEADYKKALEVLERIVVP